MCVRPTLCTEILKLNTIDHELPTHSSHSPGPADAIALLPKVLYVRVTTHVRLAVEHSRRLRASATRRQSSASAIQRPMNERRNLEVDAPAYPTPV